MPWSGGSVVVASEVQVIDSVSGRKLNITVDSSGTPGIHYTDPAAPGKSGDIFSQAVSALIQLTMVSSSYGNNYGQLVAPQLQLGPKVATLALAEPNGAYHGGRVALLDARAALEYYEPGPASPAILLNSVELNANNVLVKQPMIVTGETWHTPALNAPFVGATAGGVQYRSLPNGDVELRGGANYGSAPPVGGFTVFTLPVGYRPTRQDEYAVARQGVYSTGKVVIGTDGGVVYWVNDGATTPQFGGLHFSTLA